MPRSRHHNSNWKGGISLVRSADEILSLDDSTIEEIYRRFINLVSITNYQDCWVWNGGVFKSNGRAKLVLGTNLLASRVSFVLYKGSIGTMCVLHTCDNVLCVNPDHLFLGTNKDNSKDMVEKKRQAKGEKNGGAKLTEVEVEEIRQIVAGRKSIYGIRKSLAIKYGVHPETISRIFSGKSWEII